MSIELFLVLEDKDTKYYNVFYSSGDFEEFIKTINLDEYVYINIYTEIDGELNWGLSKIYKERYRHICKSPY